MVDEKYFPPNDFTINKTLGGGEKYSGQGSPFPRSPFSPGPPLKIRLVQKRLVGAGAGAGERGGRSPARGSGAGGSCLINSPLKRLPALYGAFSKFSSNLPLKDGVIIMISNRPWPS